MFRDYFLVGLLAVAGFTVATGANGQTKPATSGTSSFYEPESDPHGQGWYRPNVPGEPPVGGCLSHSRQCRSPRRQ
jgi:hypothetical protein